jgi:hypothetical protein
MTEKVSWAGSFQWLTYEAASPSVVPSRGIQYHKYATTNTPPFAQPGQLNFATSNFSNISSTKNSNGNNGARTLQFALKLFY